MHRTITNEEADYIGKELSDYGIGSSFIGSNKISDRYNDNHYFWVFAENAIEVWIQGKAGTLIIYKGSEEVEDDESWCIANYDFEMACVNTINEIIAKAISSLES